MRTTRSMAAFPVPTTFALAALAVSGVLLFAESTNGFEGHNVGTVSTDCAEQRRQPLAARRPGIPGAKRRALSVVEEDAEQCTPAEERDVLLGFKASRTYAEDGALSSWDETVEVCEDWWGVVCDGSGHVTHLELRREEMTGTVPSELSCFPRLQQINMGGNYLTGTLPTEWSTMTTLTRIRLKNNMVTGTLPPEWSTLTALRALALSRNDLTGLLPDSWSTLTKLKFLYAEQMSIFPAIPRSYGNIEVLRLAIGGDPALGK